MKKIITGLTMVLMLVSSLSRGEERKEYLLKELEAQTQMLLKLAEAKKFEEAIAQGRKALALSERVYGAESRDTALILYRLGDLHAKTHQSAEAEKLYLRASAIQAKVLGREHLDFKMTQDALAAVYLAAARFDDLELLAKEILAKNEAGLCYNRYSLVQTLERLADVAYMPKGRYEDAEFIYARILAACEKALGSEDAFVVMIQDDLARCIF